MCSIEFLKITPIIDNSPLVGVKKNIGMSNKIVKLK